MTTNLSSAVTTLAALPMLVLLAKATLILVLAVGVTIAMQRASAGSRHLVWLVTLAALLLVPGLTAWAPFRVRVLPAIAATELNNTRIDKALDAASGPILFAASRNGGSAAALTSAPSTVPPAPTGIVSRIGAMSPISLLMFIWAVVVAAIAASLGYASLVVRRIVRRSSPLDTQDWVGPMWEVADRLGLDDAPRLLRSEDAKMPFACGLLRPTIVLPAECDSWTLDRRRAVLLHELAHVRRHDLVGHTLGRLACAVYWFHPLVWTAAKQLRSESERACDDLALSCGARATDYAEHLLDIVTSVRGDATPSVALAMARRKEFEGRMLAILDPELRHSSPTRRQSAALIGSLALISIVVGAAAPARRVEAETQGQLATHRSKDKLKLEKSKLSVEADANANPDSRDIESGLDKPAKEYDFHSQTVQSEQTVQHTTENTVNNFQRSTNAAVGDLATAAASAGIAVGTSTADALLRIIGKGFGQGKQKSGSSDERPALLANVLRTDASPDLRRVAAWGLAEYADDIVAANALADAVRRDSDPAVREMAAWALSDAKESGTVVDALTGALRGDANVRVRATAAWSLGSIGARSSVDALSAALADASPEVRTRAAWAIGSVGPKQAPRALINMLGDKDLRVRSLAAWALYEIQDPAAIPALESALRAESSKELQIDYIRALAAIGEQSVDALRSLLESHDPEIKAIAVRALAGGNATGPWPWPWPEPRPSP